MLLKENRFYVYALLDTRKPGNYLYNIDDKVFILDYEPFYIGKGTGKRAYWHLKLHKLGKSTNPIKANKINKIKKNNR